MTYDQKVNLTLFVTAMVFAIGFITLIKWVGDDIKNHLDNLRSSHPLDE